MKKICGLIFALCLFISAAQAQTGEVTVSFNEQFFDALFDAVFKNLKQPDFPLAENSPKSKVQSPKSLVLSFDSKNNEIANRQSPIENSKGCNERIVLQREVSGVRTAVRFRDGRIYAPIAFSGSYNPPLIGCVDFQGYAETNIELEFNAEQQSLIGRVRVLNVQLENVPNLAGGFIARLVQSSIDRKINPIEILRADKLSFIVPVQNSGGALKLKATKIRHEVGDKVLNVYVNFEFLKAE